jgi:hypothetical protein
MSIHDLSVDLLAACLRPVIDDRLEDNCKLRCVSSDFKQAALKVA